jgi:hypothetical protein
MQETVGIWTRFENRKTRFLELFLYKIVSYTKYCNYIKYGIKMKKEVPQPSAILPIMRRRQKAAGA